MAIRYSCTCGRRFSIDERYVGRKIRCKHCRREFYVPQPPDRQFDKPKVAETADTGLTGPTVVHQGQHVSSVSDHSGSGDSRRSQCSELSTPRRNFLPVWIAWGVLAAFLAVCWVYWLLQSSIGTRDIVERAESSVSVAQITGSIGSGTGFLVEKNLLATNAHVIGFEFAKDLEVHFPSARGEARGPYPARIVYEDTKRDLAILEVQVDLPPLELARSYAFHRGDDVTIIGNPGLGASVTLQNAVARGIMSTAVTLDRQHFYQLGVSLNPGNSGGPVLGADGKVIGVATLKATNAEGVGFCIPIEDLISALGTASATSQQASATVERAHRARAVFMRMAVSGVVYRTQLDLCLSSLSQSTQTGGNGVESVRAVFKECAAKAAAVGSSLEKSVRPELTLLAKDGDIQENLRHDLSEMWRICSDMKGCIDEPRGTYESYRDSIVSLGNKFVQLAARLRIATNAAD
jgi:S1-C subfamily serine protease